MGEGAGTGAWSSLRCKMGSASLLQAKDLLGVILGQILPLLSQCSSMRKITCPDKRSNMKMPSVAGGYALPFKFRADPIESFVPHQVPGNDYVRSC